MGNKLAKMIPKKPAEDKDEVTLTRAYELNPEIEEYLATDESIRKLWMIASRLEGCKKASSSHACGHIPTPIPCEDLFPCRVDSNDERFLVCEYDMIEAEHLGNLKKDLLMLRNLTIIDQANKAIKARYGIDVPLWADEIFNDAEALKLFATGDTDGLFQFESDGMKKFMKELKPTCFEDIIAGVALYRPGPMDYIPAYIAGKKDPSSVKYLCPELEPILKNTYGQIVYQEQVMRITTDLAGFSKGRSDKVRKAMGKKQLSVMLAEKENFIYGNAEENVKGCINNGISEAVAVEIWARMEKFAEYAFNKAHAACYAAIAMQTAYLKAHYPTEFMAGLLTSVIDEKAEVKAKYIYNTMMRGVIIHKPDINTSTTVFTPNTDGSITYALSSIRNVGGAVCDMLVAERTTNGAFRGIEDFLQRVPTANKRVVEYLVKAGAFDGFGHSRKAMLEFADKFKADKKAFSGQMSLFEIGLESTKDTITDCKEMPKRELLSNEKDAVGYYISGHPTLEYLPMLSKRFSRVADLIPELDDEGNIIEAASVPEGNDVYLLACPEKIKSVITKKGDKMATLRLEDGTADIRAVCFPKAFEVCGKYLESGTVLVIEGKLGEDNEGGLQVIIDEAVPVEQAPHRVYVKVKTQSEVSAVNDAIALAYDTVARDHATVYIEDTKEIKQYPASISKKRAMKELRAFLPEESLALKIV